MARVRAPNAVGVLYMTVGSIAAVLNDGLVRLAIEEGLDTYQALFLRGCGMIAILGAARRLRGERFDPRSVNRPLVTRIAAEVVVAGAFFTAIVHVDFANAQTILMAAPFVVTVVAARLGEPVSPGQYLVVAVGFVGVIAVVRPTPEGFSPWTLLVLVAAAAIVVREFATQRVPSTTSPLTIALLTAMAITAMTGAVSVATGWGTVTARATLMLALACLLLVAGYVLLIETVRIGDLSISAPFRYTTVVGAVIVGFAMFGESPDVLTIVGCALIVSAGIVASRFERLDDPMRAG